MKEKKFIIRHCSNYKVSDKRWYEAHYSDGSNCKLFSVDSYRHLIQFTDLLKEAGYKYIENEQEY